jgi:hypothetical protein
VEEARTTARLTRLQFIEGEADLRFVIDAQQLWCSRKTPAPFRSRSGSTRRSTSTAPWAAARGLAERPID